MASRHSKTWTGRVYTGTDPQTGKEQYVWVGRFPTKRERDAAVARRRLELAQELEQKGKPKAETITCDEWADRYLAKVEREQKSSSLSTARQALRRFRSDFGDRPIGSISDLEAEDWALRVPACNVPPVVTCMNYAVSMRVLEHNPFANKRKRTRGRADKHPPSVKEMEALLDGCDALGCYAGQMRNLLEFGAYTCMRPGELFELRWADIDFATNRIHVARRLYRGGIDVPKNGKPKTIALPPPARDIVLRQPTRAREDGLVFQSKTGRQLTATTLCQYWALVKAHAHLPQFDVYEVVKHLAVHRLFRLGLSERAIAAQAGWSAESVRGMLAVYAHADAVALAEVDALYERVADPLRTEAS